MKHIAANNEHLQQRLNGFCEDTHNLKAIVKRPMRAGDVVEITHSDWQYADKGFYSVHENVKGLFIICKGVPMYTQSKTFNIIFKYRVWEVGV